MREVTRIQCWFWPFAAISLLACGGGEEQTRIQRVESPQRIIAIAPSVAEMLYALGQGSRVGGVGDYVKYPPEAAGKPKLGGLFDARLEEVVLLRPDLAILLPSEETLKANLEGIGVEVLTVQSESLSDVEDMAVVIGERLGVPEATEAFLRKWQADLAPRPIAEAPRVLVAVSRTPGRMGDMLVSGPGTFVDELLGRLEAPNVLADSDLLYPRIGLEEVVVRRPDVVIELQPEPGTYELLSKDWRGLGADSGLADVCVRVIAGDHVLIPGPRLTRLYAELREALVSCVGAS